MVMESLKKGFVVAIALFAFSACAPKPLYFYGDYSDCYYKNKKTVSEENSSKLKSSMENAIENVGKSTSGRVPPGMYASLGYMYLKDGKAQMAIGNFEKEKETYPESSHFMDRIISKVELMEGEVK